MLSGDVSFLPSCLLPYFLTWFLVGLTTSLGAASVTGAKRVLVVHSFGNAAPPFTTHSIAFETELTAKMGEPVDLDEVSLDVARYATLDMEEALVEFMRKRQSKWQPDLVVPIGSPAGVFVAQYRNQLFPGTTPVIYTGMDQRRLPSGALLQNAAFVGESFDLPGLVRDILQLAPATTNIAVVIGASPLERFWTEVLRQEYQPFMDRVSFTWFNDLSFDQMLDRAATMPPHSFILLILLMRDAMGVTHNADEALKRIHAVANAPINSLFEHQLGLGIVGGRLYPAELEGIESARIAVRMLHGESITNFPPRIIGPRGPSYDWRELQRWNIGEDRLPVGSRVLFREPNAWERYKGRIIAIMSICLGQGLLISLLLANLIRRRRAERNLRENEQRMTLAADAAHLGMWVWEKPERHMWTSPKWKTIHGYGPDEIIRFDALLDRIHPEDRDVVQRVVNDAFNKQSSFFVQHRVILPGGDVRWISKSGRVEQRANNGSLRLLGISIDVTDRREAEEAVREVSGKLITAQEDERRRIARELHDDLNQRLALLSVEADLLGRLDHNAEAQPLIEGIASQVRNLSTEVHKLSYQLHPAKLEQLGLVSATRALCQEQSKQWGMPIEFVYDEVPRDLSRATALCIYRVVQEALQNMGKHSNAKRARVEIKRDSDQIQLVVSDDGRGFDMAKAVHHAGLGLVGMRERARLAHGRISFHSVPGQGMRIEMRVPIAVEEVEKVSDNSSNGH